MPVERPVHPDYSDRKSVIAIDGRVYPARAREKLRGVSRFDGRLTSFANVAIRALWDAGEGIFLRREAPGAERRAKNISMSSGVGVAIETIETIECVAKSLTKLI